MIARALLGIVFGCTLSLALVGIYAQIGPSSFDRNLIHGALLVIPAWIASIALMFVGTTARPALIAVLLLNALCYLALRILQSPGT